MKVAQLPANEKQRLKALNEYYTLHSLPEKDFGDFATLCAQICETDESLIFLIDANRQWCKPARKSRFESLLSDFSFRSGVKNGQLINIPDTLNNDTYKHCKSVTGDPNIRFFAQIPLIYPPNTAIGAICILNTKPFDLTDKAIAALKAMAALLGRQIALTRKVSELNQSQIEQKSAYADLEKFSFVASHDLKSPLNNIISLTTLLKSDFSSHMSEEAQEYISFLNNAAVQLSELVSGILEYSRSSQILVDNKETIVLDELLEEVKYLLKIPDTIRITLMNSGIEIKASRIALKQILLNLCDNAIKHNDKPDGKIEIFCSDGKKYYTFEVRDNGPGIEKKDQTRIFELFERINNHSRIIEGIGVGLSIVKRLVEKSGGEIKVSSEKGQGTSFFFTIQK